MVRVHLGYCIAPLLVILHPSHPFSTSCGLVRSCLAARRCIGVTRVGVTLGSSPRRFPPTTALPTAAARPSKTHRWPLPTLTPTPVVTHRMLGDFGEPATAPLAASTPFSSPCVSPSPSCLLHMSFPCPFVHVHSQCVFGFGFCSDTGPSPQTLLPACI